MKKIISTFLCIWILLSFNGCELQKNSSDVTGWQLIHESNMDICDGVSYLERNYTDQEQLPYKVYILLIDPQKATLHTGTSNDKYELIPTLRQNVLEQMISSEQNGLEVVAAVNGDFFAIASSYQPSGLCVKNQKLISANLQHRPYSAITADGRYVIGDGKAQEDPSGFTMAVGGSRILLTDGQIATFDESDSHANTAHPRTIAGARKDGTIILAVIDGRQPDLSNGATLTQCAELMQALGAVNAINHDGGGSSTIIIKNNGNFQVKNSPSDGNLRSIYNSIQVIKLQ